MDTDCEWVVCDNNCLKDNHTTPVTTGQSALWKRIMDKQYASGYQNKKLKIQTSSLANTKQLATRVCIKGKQKASATAQANKRHLTILFLKTHVRLWTKGRTNKSNRMCKTQYTYVVLAYYTYQLKRREKEKKRGEERKMKKPGTANRKNSNNSNGTVSKHASTIYNRSLIG